MHNFLKKNLVAKGSWKNDHSNYQRKYFSESSESMDVGKSHAECNVAHFSGSKVEILQCTVIKKVIQEKKACVVKKHKWRSDACIMYGFCHTKEEMLNPYPSGHCLFYTIYLIKVIRLQDV